MSNNKITFDTNLKTAWKNPEHLGSCFLIAYNELLQQERELNIDIIDNIDDMLIDELKYYMRKLVVGNSYKKVYENKISALLNEIGQIKIIKVFREYKKIATSSEDLGYATSFA